MTNDLVSDMLTRIRNASMARHNFLCSLLPQELLRLLNLTYCNEHEQSYADGLRAGDRFDGFR